MQIQALPGMRDRLRKNRRTFSLPPIVGAIELAIGIVLLVVGIKKDLEMKMFIVRITMHVLPEKRKEFLQTLLSLIGPPEKEKGCMSYDIFCEIHDKNAFNLISEWQTRRHVDHHIRSERFSVLLGTKSLLCEPLKIQILTVSGSEGVEAVNSVRK